MRSEREFIERIEREAFERGRAQGHAEGQREGRLSAPAYLAAHADPANHERARQFAWAERWAAGDISAPFDPPAETWPDDIADVDVYIEQYIDEQVLRQQLAPQETRDAPAGPLTEQLRAVINTGDSSNES